MVSHGWPHWWQSHEWRLSLAWAHFLDRSWFHTNHSRTAWPVRRLQFTAIANVIKCKLMISVPYFILPKRPVAGASAIIPITVIQTPTQKRALCGSGETQQDGADKSNKALRDKEPWLGEASPTKPCIWQEKPAPPLPIHLYSVTTTYMKPTHLDLMRNS